jgi:hypothetical protein
MLPAMAEENDAGANYLASLRQSSGSHAAAAAPARAKNGAGSAEAETEIKTGDLPPPETVSPARADKRKSPRYKCAGSARIQEIGGAVATWATFADISMHGCYVETAAPHRVGATLALKLDANGFRVEVTGEARVIYPGLGMGISFTKISDENRERLRALVRSISRPSVILGSLSLGSRVEPRPPSPPTPQSGASPAVANPAAALQAILKFVENRHVMGREEFLRILRLSQ